MAGQMTLDFIQIYYDDIQQEEIYPFSQPYKNYGLTPFFENSIISELVPASNADLISVCSWALKRKRQNGPTPIVLKGDTSLTEEKILCNDFDVAVLTPRSASHKMLHMASQWHGKVWDNAFYELQKFLGRTLKNELRHPIYENHFIAKREIYQAYVKDLLNPCIEYMKTNEIFMLPSGYSRRKRANPEEVGRVRAMLGFEDWPIAPFVLERLFSIYINDKGLNVINL
jgi:hypothetical protein